VGPRRAAEHATRDRGGVRGATLADVLHALPAAWRDVERAGGEPLAYPVLAELPAVPG
jgi:hypothetical protein